MKAKIKMVAVILLTAMALVSCAKSNPSTVVGNPPDTPGTSEEEGQFGQTTFGEAIFQ